MTVFKVGTDYYRSLQEAMSRVAEEVNSFMRNATVPCRGQWRRYKKGIRYTIVFRPQGLTKMHQRSFSICFYEVNNKSPWQNLN